MGIRQCGKTFIVQHFAAAHYKYEEIIERLEEEKTHMNQLMEQSTIREEIDTDFVNQLMIDIKKKQLGDI